LKDAFINGFSFQNHGKGWAYPCCKILCQVPLRFSDTIALLVGGTVWRPILTKAEAILSLFLAIPRHLGLRMF
jgi:hypothetical protein